MHLELRYTTSQGVEIDLQLRAPVSMLAGGDGSHLSPRENQDVMDAACARAMPQLSTLFTAIVSQVHSTLQQSCVESLRLHARAKMPLTTDLSPAGEENQREEMP